MQMAIDVAGFTPAEADELRQAMGSKRVGGADGAAARAAVRRDGRAGHHRRRRRRDLREDDGVRQLRLPREPLGVASPTSSTRRRGSSATAGGVLRRAAQRPADGLLVARTRSCSDARRHGVVVRTPDLNASLAGATLEPCSSRRATGDVPTGDGRSWRCGWGSGRCAGSATTWPRRSRRRRPTGRTPTSRTSSAGCRRSRCRSSRRWPPPGCSASASASSGARRCGRSGAVAQSRPGPAGRHGHRRRRRRRCPGMTPVEEAVADLWATGVSPDGHPTQFLRDAARRARASSPSTGLWRRRRRARGCWSPASSPTASGR